MVLILLIFKGFLCAQTGDVSQLMPQPVFRIDVVERVTVAINFSRLSGATRIDFRGTPLMPFGRGEAKIESKRGYMQIEVEFQNMEPATEFGAEYLTYVLWAITPEGRAANLGEVLVRRGRSNLNVTVELQVFGLLVTAEPYFAVRQPSDLVVLENEVRQETEGAIELIDARYELLKRGQYEQLANPLMLALDPKIPVELYEARNAVQIARASGAGAYAADTFLKAEHSLRQAEAYQSRGEGQKPVIMLARETVQRAEDAREIAVRRRQEEDLERERQAAAERELRAREAAEQETKQRVDAEAREQQEAQRRVAAEQLAKQQAGQMAAEREQMELVLMQSRERARDAEAQVERTLALLDDRTEEFRRQRERWEAERQRREAEESERARRLAELGRAESRVRLYSQLNRVLTALDTDEGLVVELSADFFDSDLPDVSRDGRERLAMVSGILMAYPELVFRVRGADRTGTLLAAGRAETVRRYLKQQGLREMEVPETTLREKSAAADGAGGPGQPIELIIRGDSVGLPVEQAIEQTRPF